MAPATRAVVPPWEKYTSSARGIVVLPAPAGHFGNSKSVSSSLGLSSNFVSVAGAGRGKVEGGKCQCEREHRTTSFVRASLRYPGWPVGFRRGAAVVSDGDASQVASDGGEDGRVPQSVGQRGDRRQP